MPDLEIGLDKFVSYVSATQDPEWTYTMELIRAGK